MTCTRATCDASAPAGLYLCEGCVTVLAGILSRATDVLTTAWETVAKQGGNTGGSGGGGVSSAPVNLDALARVDAYRATLTRHPGIVSGRSPEYRARFAARHVWSGALTDDLSRLEAALVAVVDHTAEWLVLGPCGNDEAGCRGQYRYQPGQDVAVCRKCGVTMRVAEYRAWQVRHAVQHPAPLNLLVRTLAEAGLPVKLNTAQAWVRRGKLAPHHCDEDGRCMYTAAAVMDVLEGNRRPV